jgi:DNA-binding Xre family transcriptional regulator
LKLSYKGLWELLIVKDMSKRELSKIAGISHTTVSELSKGESVTTDTLLKICEALDCDVSDIVAVEKTERLTEIL